MLPTMVSKNNPYILTMPEENYGIPKESIGKYIYNCLKSRDPNDIINIDATSKETLTAGRLLEDSIKITYFFKTLALSKGDTISIIRENTLDYFVPVAAALYMGIAVAPLNPAYLKAELTHALNISKPKVIICSEYCVESVIEIKSFLPFIETIIVTDSKTNNTATFISLDNELKRITVDINNFKPCDLDYAEQIAFLLSSSGTTGLPKSVILTHKNLYPLLGCLRLQKYFNVSSKDTTILVIPYFHMFGIMVELMAITAGMKIVLMQKFNPSVYLQSIQDFKVTKPFMVPTLLLFLTKSPMVKMYDLSSIKELYVSAAPVGKELFEAARKRFKNLPIRNMFGMTETAGTIIVGTTDLNKTGSIGILVPGASVKVCDNNGKLLGALGIGELCFKGDMVTKGYLGNEEETNSFFDADGFCHSGDLGYFDKDGYLYFVDRKKDLIKYKGFQVSPVELETLIISHPKVKNCAVIGIPDEKCGQLPFAFVVKQNGFAVTNEEITNFVAERISVQKHLHGGVQFVEEIPTNALGKILRKKLLDLWKANLC